MSLFAIADLHLSLGSDKPMDIFNGWANYTEKIERNWHKVVSDKDTVVIAGDISWALKLEETYNDFDFINRLPGTKIFIKGNHDLWWSTKSKLKAYLSKNGFDTIKIVYNDSYQTNGVSVCGSRGWFFETGEEADKKILSRELGRVESSLKDAQKYEYEPIVFLHYPPLYDTFRFEQMIELLKKYSVKECYYGHIHGKGSKKGAIVNEYDGIKFRLISCDFIGFMPIVVR